MKKILLLFILLAIYPGISSAQNIPNVSSDSLSKHVYYLASAELKGRDSGSEGQKLAAQYIASYFKQYNLIPAGNSTLNPYFQEFIIYTNEVYYEFPHKISGKAPWKKFSQNILYFGNNKGQGNRVSYKLCLKNHQCCEDTLAYRYLAVSNLQQMTDSVQYLYEHCATRKFFVQLPNQVFKPISQNYIDGRYLLYKSDGKYKRLKYGDSDSKQDMDAYTNVYNIVHKFSNLELILISPSFWTENGYSNFSEEQNNNIAFNVFKTKVNDSIFTENVAGYIPGKSSGKVVIIGAHYDHLGYSDKGIFYGADDNASGTAALIEIARLFANNTSADQQPEKSILFISFSAEELGLLGSEVYVQFPFFPIDSTAFMLNMDMIGRPEATGNKKSHTLFASYGRNNKAIMKTVKKSSKEMKSIKAYTHPGLINSIGYRFGSDHDRFVRRKIPACVFFTGLHEDYHKITDTPDKINYQNMTRITTLVYLSALKLSHSE